MANGFLLAPTPVAAVTVQGVPALGTGANLLNDYMGMVLKLGVGVALDLRLDLGANPPAIDTLALLEVTAPPGTAWTIQAAASDVWTAPALTASGTMPDDSPTASGARHLLWLGDAPATYRWWRIQLAAVPGHAHQLARVLPGLRVQPERNFSFGVARGVQDLGEIDFTPRGAIMRRMGRKLRTLGLAWDFLSQSEAETLALPLLEAVGSTGFVLACLNPEPDPQRSRRLYFGPLQGDVALTWRNARQWQKRLELVSVI